MTLEEDMKRVWKEEHNLPYEISHLDSDGIRKEVLVKVNSQHISVTYARDDLRQRIQTLKTHMGRPYSVTVQPHVWVKSAHVKEKMITLATKADTSSMVHDTYNFLIRYAKMASMQSTYR